MKVYRIYIIDESIKLIHLIKKFTDKYSLLINSHWATDCSKARSFCSKIDLVERSR